MSKKKLDPYSDFDKQSDIQAFKDSVDEFFKDVPDPRMGDNCKFPLTSLLVMMLMAVVAGANNILAINDYAQEKRYLFRELLDLNEIPQYNTFWWLITRMNPEKFASSFYKWVEDVRVKDIPDKAIHIDGKCLRGALNRKGNHNIHIVHAWSSKESLLIGQLKTDEKSNEITAIPELLDLIDIEGATITIDAAGCQKNIADKICDKGAHYVLAVKGNQPTLHNEIINLFETAHNQNFYYVPNSDLSESIEKGHGRIEKRSIAVCSDTSGLPDEMKNDWRGLETFVEVTTERTLKNKTSVEKRYYISDLMLSGKEFGEIIRTHWSVENNLHWKLDVIFKEDESRANILHAAENLATLRRMALDVFNYEIELKMGTTQKRRRAGWGDATLLKLLDNFFVKKF
jgi:predicted transposase YbfD/YdcC